VSRPRLALIVAFVALLAALVGAIGPAHHVSTTYSWPPETLPTGSPKSVWYTPLLLIGRQPEAVSARVPCSLPPALPGAARPVLVLATARFPERVDGLSLIRSGDRLVVSSGGEVLARVGLPSAPTDDDACAYHLVLGGGSWSLEGGPGQIALGGDLETMPFVNGVFSALDLRWGMTPTIDVTTSVHASRTTARQTMAWTIAVLFAIAALLLVAVERRPRRPWAVGGSAIRAAAARARPEDAVVAVVLLGWWVISPAFGYDDGWVVARQSMFASSRGFSNYYDSLGANHPLGFWLEWAQHWLTEATDALLILRVPALLCLAAIWVLCRWILARALVSSAGEDRVALWALTSTFVVGALAWGMTLRPEPEIALLATGVMACTVLFVERETAAPLAVAAVLVVLAGTAHPAGIVSIAPLIVALPSLARLARARLAVLASIITSALALLLVLAFVGSDLEQRRADARTIRLYGDAVASWREEINRYADLLIPYYGTPLRRESVALMALAVLVYLLRSRREKRILLDLPATGLAVALLLLIPTPSKWPWHFGALLGIAAIAVATETARLRDDARHSPGWSARPLIVVGAAVVAAAWSWSPRRAWTDLDLQTLDWTLGFESSDINLSKLGGLAPLALLAGAGLFELVRGRRERIREIPWSVASWTAPVLAIPLIAFTVGVLVTDAARTRSWTLTSQNLETLRGDLRCGLADDAVVAVPESMRAVGLAGAGRRVSTVPAWVPEPPINGLPRFALGPVGPRSVARSQWFDLPPAHHIGLFLAGTPGLLGTLELEWGRERGSRIHTLESDEITAASAPEVRLDISPWRFFPAGELPSRPKGANAVRIAQRTAVATGATIAITAPVTYPNMRLVDRLERAGSRTLVLSNLLTYVPCADQPRLGGGIVEVPAQVVALRDSVWPIFGRATSPFEGVLDLYRLERLPLADSKDPPGNVVLYEVDQRIPGAVNAPPDATTVVS